MALSCNHPGCRSVGLKALRDRMHNIYHYFCLEHYPLYKDLPTWHRDSWCEYEDKHALQQAERYPDPRSENRIKTREELKACWRECFIPAIPGKPSFKILLGSFDHGVAVYRLPQEEPWLKVRCHRCGRRIRGTSVPLGISTSNEVLDPSDPRATQGVFDFGPDCAKLLRETGMLDHWEESR